MASPSSGSTGRPILIDDPAEAAGVVVVAGLGDAVAADYAAYLGREARAEAFLVADRGIRALDRDGRSLSTEECARATPETWGGPPPTCLVLFLPPRLDEAGRREVADLLAASSRWPARFVAIVGSFRVHLDDPGAEEVERFALSLIHPDGPRVAVFRPGLVLSPNSGATRWLGRLAPFAPLAPTRLRSCFLDGDELFAAIEAGRTRDEREADGPRRPGRSPGRRRRAFTMLGANSSWRSMLERHRGSSAGQKLASMASTALSWLLVGQLVGLVASILAARVARARAWDVAKIRPRSIGELLSLCHPGNIDRIRVVGYNNGVNHFGHRHPGRTIVSTGRCRRLASGGPGILKADCGATIRDARDDLATRGEELYVMPNYSYVAIGTAFFVPIHGSAVDYSTVADTAVRVVLYDPDQDRIVSAGRADDAFRENVYNPRSRVVVLRLSLKVKPRSSYYVRRETVKSQGGAELLAALRDREADNVEIRQGHAASESVTISRYYTRPDGPSGPALELPRDALGRLWDRLEENPVTSFLMHATSRHLAWHTELFFTPSQFERFWSTHAQVPLRKIQLRHILRDGMPHSPFRDEDCVSADLFLFRPDKPAFDAYLDRTFESVRTNPGKHSN